MITLLVLMLLGDAMVREDATFYLEAGNGSVELQFHALDPGHTIPVKIVSTPTHELLEIEFEQADTCASRRVTRDERISGQRFYVKRADLAQVVTKPFAITYPNGTSARIAPGVPVVPTADGSYVITTRGDRVILPIPASSVGYTYKRGKVVEPEQRGTRWQLDGTRTVKLGDADLEARGRWIATKPATHGDTVRLKWSARCIDLVVAVSANDLVKHEAVQPMTPLFKSQDPKLVDWVPTNTPLSTADGRAVGFAAYSTPVWPAANGMACFDAVLTEHVLDDLVRRKYVRAYQVCANANAAVPIRATLQPVPTLATREP